MKVGCFFMLKIGGLKKVGDKQIIQRLADPKIMLVFALFIIVCGAFLANFILAFLQEILFAIEQFAKNKPVDFSLDWKSFFVFQRELFGFYVGFYIILGIGLLKFFYNMKMN